VTLSPCFTPRTLTFLRGLKRHNDRAWFAEHREAYERDVHQPMIALVERLARDMRAFAPDVIASPRGSLYRIYRDTRFSPNKSPFKTQVGAIFPHRDLPRHRGAAYYVEIGPDGAMAVGGVYMPEPIDLNLLREHLAANHRRFRSLVESPGFKRTVGPLSGDSLKRVPRGFPPDHPAAEYLKLKQIILGREFAAAFAVSPRFYATVLKTFERMAPVIDFLNQPLVAAAARRDPLFEEAGNSRTRRR
jgi:uncharacterized protein (TIGR02453 family)